MATSKKAAKPRTYHHGDLRRALVEAAWELVGQGGLAALTLREVARVVGVTHAAPYHHFPTRTALLDVLAEEAFVALEARMRGAMREGDDAGERLVRIGAAYIDFARDAPAQLQVMFRARRDETDTAMPASLQLAADRAFDTLLDAVITCQQQGLAPPGEPRDHALATWSVVHGFSKLWVEGPLPGWPGYGESYERQRDTLLRGHVEGLRLRASR